MLRLQSRPVRLKCLAVLCGLLALAGCATRPAPRPAPPPAPAVVIPVQPPSPSSGAPKFDAFLAETRIAALAQGITAETFDAATAGIAPLPTIIAMNANQP